MITIGYHDYNTTPLLVFFYRVSTLYKGLQGIDKGVYKGFVRRVQRVEKPLLFSIQILAIENTFASLLCVQALDKPL